MKYRIQRYKTPVSVVAAAVVHSTHRSNRVILVPTTKRRDHRFAAAGRSESQRLRSSKVFANVLAIVSRDLKAMTPGI